MSKKPTLVLVDGSAVFHRGYHAIPPLSNKDGVPTNATYGYTTILLKVISDLKPTYMVVAWDMKGPTFRHEMYPEYKGTRAKQPDDLYEQMPWARKVTESLGIPWIELERYEADDIIGTMAKQSGDLETIIVTGDKDEFQLINDTTRVYTMQRGFTDTIIYDEAKMQERYGLTPTQFLEAKALMGDSSDNIPGVPGVGEKTAMGLITSYDSLDGVYDNIDKIPGKLGERLRENKELAYKSLDLSRIALDVPVTLDLKAATLGQYDRPAIHDLFRELGFKALLSRLPQEMVETTPSLFDLGEVAPKDRAHLKTVKYSCVDSEPLLIELVKALSAAEVFAVDTETTGVDVLTASLVGLSFCLEASEAYYIPVGHQQGTQLETSVVLEALGPVLTNAGIGKVGHNIKFDYQVLHRAGVTLQGIAWDTMIGAFLLNPTGRSQSLDDLAYSELGIDMIPITELIGSGKSQATFDTVTVDQATTYAAEDADVTWRIYRRQLAEMQSGDAHSVMQLAAMTEWPLISVLARMELAGIALDSKFLHEFNKTISGQILKLEDRLYESAGQRFNIASPAQLADILYVKLALPTVNIKKGKTGLSTAADQLEKMRGAHPIIELILEYRELIKLKNTYVDTLPELVAADGRVHTSYSQTIAATGRLSSNSPNLQNIPVRTELGREIRKAFVAPAGRVLVGADYSQIELRVAAALSKDPAMIQTFVDGIDLHQQTAAELYGVPLDEVTKDQRYNAKTINFGVLYGMSAHGLSVATGMPRADAAGFIERYFEVRPVLAGYIESTKAFAREHEYTETLFGRRRPCPEINSNNHILANAAERMAVNVPIQGTAADILKLAMIALVPRLDAGTQLLLQIHDELIIETDESQGEAVATLVRVVMSGVYDLGVPLAVDTAIGCNWGEI
jgi:DNA polymerase I